MHIIIQSPRSSVGQPTATVDQPTATVPPTKAQVSTRRAQRVSKNYRTLRQIDHLPILWQTALPIGGG